MADIVLLLDSEHNRLLEGLARDIDQHLEWLKNAIPKREAKKASTPVPAAPPQQPEEADTVMSDRPETRSANKTQEKTKLKTPEAPVRTRGAKRAANANGPSSAEKRLAKSGTSSHSSPVAVSVTAARVATEVEADTAAVQEQVTPPAAEVVPDVQMQLEEPVSTPVRAPAPATAPTPVTAPEPTPASTAEPTTRSPEPAVTEPVVDKQALEAAEKAAEEERQKKLEEELQARKREEELQEVWLMIAPCVTCCRSAVLNSCVRSRRKRSRRNRLSLLKKEGSSSY